MSERNGSTSAGTGTAEIPVVRPSAGRPTEAAPAEPPRRRPPSPRRTPRSSPEADLVPGCTPPHR